MDSKRRHDYRNVNFTSKRKRVVLYKHLNPQRPEIKKWNPMYIDQSNLYKAITFSNICGATGNPTGGYSAWDLVSFNSPAQGTGPNNRVGERYSLKYLRIKGYVETNWRIAFKCNYKVLLIKSDIDLEDSHLFLYKYFKNYQYPSTWTESAHSSWPDDAARAGYGRHNYYKLVKNVETWPLAHIAIRVVADGTITNFPQDSATSTWTLGSDPSVSTTVDDGAIWKAYYPINTTVTVNDDIKVGYDRYYFMVVTDQTTGYTSNAGSKGLTRSHAYVDRAFEINFFTVGYYTDS